MYQKELIQPLYEVGDRQLFYSDFVNALREAGINKGDVIFVHSDISVFGKLAVFDSDFLLASLIKAIKESVGEDGTVIMPAFSYSFCKGEVFDLLHTQSRVGTLTEYFRRQDGVKRTVHPIFSAAVWGRRRDEFLNVGKDSFDGNSIFGKLHKSGGKIVAFGSSFRESLTFLHYIEQNYGVPYRYMKVFRGIIRDGGREYEDEYTYFVRYLDKNITTFLPRLEEHLLKKALMKEVKLAGGRILMIESDILFKEGCGLLDRDIYFFLKENPDL